MNNEYLSSLLQTFCFFPVTFQAPRLLSKYIRKTVSGKIHTYFLLSFNSWALKVINCLQFKYVYKCTLKTRQSKQQFTLHWSLISVTPYVFIYQPSPSFVYKITCKLFLLQVLQCNVTTLHNIFWPSYPNYVRHWPVTWEPINDRLNVCTGNSTPGPLDYLLTVLSQPGPS